MSSALVEASRALGILAAFGAAAGRITNAVLLLHGTSATSKQFFSPTADPGALAFHRPRAAG